LQLEQVGPDHGSAGRDPFAGERNHARVDVDGDHASPWQQLEQSRGDPSRAATGIQHRLVAVELQPIEYLLGQLVHDDRDAVNRRTGASSPPSR
jgi:hypothetical protein